MKKEVLQKIIIFAAVVVISCLPLFLWDAVPEKTIKSNPKEVTSEEIGGIEELSEDIVREQLVPSFISSVLGDTVIPDRIRAVYNNNASGDIAVGSPDYSAYWTCYASGDANDYEIIVDSISGKPEYLVRMPIGWWDSPGTVSYEIEEEIEYTEDDCSNYAREIFSKIGMSVDSIEIMDETIPELIIESSDDRTPATCPIEYFTVMGTTEDGRSVQVALAKKNMQMLYIIM